MRLEHKTEVGGNLNDLCDLERRCLELLGVAEFAVRVEDLWSKDIVILPREKLSKKSRYFTARLTVRGSCAKKDFFEIELSILPLKPQTMFCAKTWTFLFKHK